MDVSLFISFMFLALGFLSLGLTMDDVGLTGVAGVLLMLLGANLMSGSVILIKVVNNTVEEVATAGSTTSISYGVIFILVGVALLISAAVSKGGGNS